MSEKRVIERHHLPYYLQVYNRVTNKPLGYIVNISSQGMMLVSKNRLLTHAIFDMQIKLPVAIDGSKRIDFEALSHWCHPDVTPGCYDTGFSFNNPPEELKSLVKALAEYFKFQFLDESMSSGAINAGTAADNAPNTPAKIAPDENKQQKKTKTKKKKKKGDE